MSFGLIAKDFATMIFFIGFGMFGVGLGIALWMLTASIYKKAFNYITKTLSKLILRGRKKDEK